MTKAIVGQRSSQLSASNDQVASETISFPPASVHAQTALCLHGGFLRTEAHDAQAIIVNLTHRPAPDGVDETLKLPFPTTVAGVVDRATSVTWKIYAGPHTFVVARIDILWWAEAGEKQAIKPSAVGLQPGLAAVIYEGQTGRIRHIHEEKALPDGRRLGAATIGRRALALARALAETKIADPNALVVSAESVRQRGQDLRVDVTTRSLIHA